MDIYLLFLELIGTIAFASSGAMVGIQKEMDVFGVSVLGMTTAVGGGLIRDLILGVTPPVMFQNPMYAITAIVVSCIVFCMAACHKEKAEGHWYLLYEKLMLLCDSLGLGIFTVVGVNAALNMEYETTGFLQVFVGVLTGVGGGCLRDIMAGNTPYIFVKHVYASASIVGAAVCVFITKPFGQLTGMLTGAVLVVMIRLLAAHFKWNLPKIRREEKAERN